MVWLAPKSSGLHSAASAANLAARLKRDSKKNARLAHLNVTRMREEEGGGAEFAGLKNIRPQASATAVP